MKPERKTKICSEGIKISLKARKENAIIVCYDIRTIQLVVGSTAVVGNYKLYGVTKTKEGFEISKKELAKRRDVLIKRRDNIEETLSIIGELVE